MIVFISIIGGIVLLIIIARLFAKKKGQDTPESLKEYFSTLVNTMDIVPPFSIIFEQHSNDGNQIVYKEKTKSRNCFIKIERYKIILDVYDNENNQIYYSEEPNGIYGGMNDEDFIKIVHDLYVNKLSNSTSKQ